MTSLPITLIIIVLVTGALGAALLTRPEWVASSTGNPFWLRSPLRRVYLRYVGGLGFLASSVLALLDLLFESVSIFPGA